MTKKTKSWQVEVTVTVEVLVYLTVEANSKDKAIKEAEDSVEKNLVCDYNGTVIDSFDYTLMDVSSVAEKEEE